MGPEVDLCLLAFFVKSPAGAAPGPPPAFASAAWRGRHRGGAGQKLFSFKVPRWSCQVQGLQAGEWNEKNGKARPRQKSIVLFCWGAQVTEFDEERQRPLTLTLGHRSLA